MWRPKQRKKSKRRLWVRELYQKHPNENFFETVYQMMKERDMDEFYNVIRMNLMCDYLAYLLYLFQLVRMDVNRFNILLQLLKIILVEVFDKKTDQY